MNYHIITWLYTSLSIATLEQHYTMIATNAAITTKQMHSQHNDRLFMSCWYRKISKIPQCNCPLSHNTLLWNITAYTSLQMWVILGYEIGAFWGLRDWLTVCIVVCWQSPHRGSTWEALGNNNYRNGLLTILGVDTQYRVAWRLTSMISTNHIYICCCLFRCSDTGKRFSNRKETRCLPLLNAGFEPRGSLKPSLQQTECLLTNQLSYRGSS